MSWVSLAYSLHRLSVVKTAQFIAGSLKESLPEPPRPLLSSATGAEEGPAMANVFHFGILATDNVTFILHCTAYQHTKPNGGGWRCSMISSDPPRVSEENNQWAAELRVPRAVG